MSMKKALEKLLKLTVASYKDLKVGDYVRNVNNQCVHFKSYGKVIKIESLANDSGYLIHYQVENSGPTYRPGDILTKTEDQLEKIK